MGILNKLFGRKESKGTKNSETEGRKPIPPDRLSKIKRGGFGEPYCSDKCYSKAGKEISDRIHGYEWSLRFLSIICLCKYGKCGRSCLISIWGADVLCL